MRFKPSTMEGKGHGDEHGRHNGNVIGFAGHQHTKNEAGAGGEHDSP
jgi:hypothetical protein